MAQKKGRSDKSTKDASPEGSALILDYLRKQNRPYSAIDISTNLHNKVSKTYAVKALRELHQKKEIACRVAGKQMVYHALQEELNKVGPDVIAAMDEEIQSLQEQLPGLTENDKKMQGELNSINTVPLPSELRTEIEKLEKEKGSLAAHVAKMDGDGSAYVSPLEKENVRRAWKLWQNQARLRAQICHDIWRKCSEILPENMTRDELWEGLGLEGTPM